MNDSEMLLAFERCTLPAAAWTHEAHVRVAWTYLERHDEATALHLVRKGIQRFNAAVIKKDGGYHETITVAFIRLIAHHRAELPPRHDFDAFKAAAPNLLDRTLSALLRHYRRETLFSDAARHGWIGADLLPLPSN
jgi:hypothetical protein